jgi:hypothetical protein
MSRIEVFLLVENLLDLGEEGVLQVTGVFGKGQKHSCSLVQIQIPVYILFIQLLHHQLLQLRTADVAVSQSQQNSKESRSVASGEGLYPLNCDRGDDGVETIVDFKVPLADMFEQMGDMPISEQLQILLHRRGHTFTRTARVLQLGAVKICESTS